MASTGKKIIFEGAENGLYNTIDTAKRKAVDMYETINKKATESALTEKERLEFIEQEIKALERLSRAQTNLVTQKEDRQIFYELKEKLLEEKGKAGDNTLTQQLIKHLNANKTSAQVDKPTVTEPEKIREIIVEKTNQGLSATQQENVKQYASSYPFENFDEKDIKKFTHSLPRLLGASAPREHELNEAIFKEIKNPEREKEQPKLIQSIERVANELPKITDTEQTIKRTLVDNVPPINDAKQNVIRELKENVDEVKNAEQVINITVKGDIPDIEDAKQTISRYVKGDIPNVNDTEQNITRKTNDLPDLENKEQIINRKVTGNIPLINDVEQTINRKVSGEIKNIEDVTQNIKQEVKSAETKKPETLKQVIEQTVEGEKKKSNLTEKESIENIKEQTQNKIESINAEFRPEEKKKEVETKNVVEEIINKETIKETKVEEKPRSFVSNVLNQIKTTDENAYKNIVGGALKKETAVEQESFISTQAKKLELESNEARREKENITNKFAVGDIKVDEAKESIANLDKVIEKNEKLIALTRELIEAVKLTSKEEINEDKKGVEEQVKEFGKHAKEAETSYRSDEPVSDEEKLVRTKQKEDLKKEGVDTEKQPGFFKDFLKASLLVEGIKGIARFGTGTALGAAEAQSGETFMANTISQANPFGIPIGAFFGGAMQRRNTEQFKVEQAESKFAGITGKADTSLSKMNNKTLDDVERFGDVINANKFGEKFGYGLDETLEARGQFSKASGKMVNRENAAGALAIEKNFSLNRGTINEQFEVARLSENKISPLTNVAAIRDAMPALKLDSSQLEEVLKLQADIIKENSNVIEKADRGKTTGMISQFREIDSEFFKDPNRLAPIISSINSSLQKPGNDFGKARNFQVLSEMMPGADYFDIIKAQSKGIEQEGFLNKILEFQKESTGGGKNLATAITGKEFGGGGILNLAPEVAEAVSKAFEKNPELLKNFGGTEEELKDKLSIKKDERNILSAAESKVTVREKEKLKIDEAFVEGITHGMKEVGKQTGQEFINELKKNEKTFTFLGVNFAEGIGNYMSTAFGLDNPFLNQEDKDAEKRVSKTARDLSGDHGKAAQDSAKGTIQKSLMQQIEVANNANASLDKFSSSLEMVNFNKINVESDTLAEKMKMVSDSVVKFNGNISKFFPNNPINNNNGVREN